MQLDICCVIQVCMHKTSWVMGSGVEVEGWELKAKLTLKLLALSSTCAVSWLCRCMYVIKAAVVALALRNFPWSVVRVSIAASAGRPLRQCLSVHQHESSRLRG